MYGKGHWSELDEEQYERLKDYIALVAIREEKAIVEFNKAWGN